MAGIRPGQPPVELLKIIHTNDPSGRRLHSVSQIRGNAGLQDSARQTYTYDRDGNRIETVFQGLQAGVWADQRKETFSYERVAAR